MQRQDDFQIDRSNILLFITQLLSLADAVIRIVAFGRPVDDRLLHAFVRSETAMLIVLGGIVSNTDARGITPGINDIIAFDEPDDRHAELLRIGASLRQIAMALALLLAMHPRAFRDRLRTASFRGGAADPGIQSGDLNAHLAAAFVARSVSGFAILLSGSGATASLKARAPP